MKKEHGFLLFNMSIVIQVFYNMIIYFFLLFFSNTSFFIYIIIEKEY
jgi:hypothetical protein